MIKTFRTIYLSQALIYSLCLLHLYCATTPKQNSEAEKKEVERKDQVKEPLEQKKAEKSPVELLKEMQNRENPDLAMHKVKGPLDLNVLSSAEGLSEISGKGIHIISIPVGSQSPVECTLIEGNQSPSYVMKKLFDNIKENAELANVSIKAISAGILSKIPYLYLDTEYTTKDKQYGNIKSVSLSSIGFVLTCFHDELGYQKTFLKVAESLAASSAIQTFVTNVAQYKSRHINLIKINGNLSGIMENYVFESNDITTNYYSITNIIAQGSPTELINGESVDDVEIEKASGYITSAKYYSYQNDSVEYQIQLNADSANEYKITGTHLGKNVNAKINSSPKIMHFEYVANQIASDLKFRSKVQLRGSFKFSEYLAGDPLKIFESTITIKSKAEKIIKFLYSSAKATLKVDLDQSGISRVEMDNENTKILIERVFAQ